MPKKGKGKGNKSPKGTKPQASKNATADSKSDGSKGATEKTAGATSPTSKAVPSPTSGVSPSSQPSTMKPSNSKTTPSPKTEPAKTAQPPKPTDSQGKAAAGEKPKETPVVQPKGSPSKTEPGAKPKQTSGPTDSQNKTAPGAKTNETTGPTDSQNKTTPGAKPKETIGSKDSQSKTVPGAKPHEPAGSQQQKPASAAPACAASLGKESAQMPTDALDELVGSLGSPEPLPESHEFTGPAVTDYKPTSVHMAKLGERDDTLPPDYRKLLEKDSSPDKGTHAGKAEEKAPEKPKHLPSESDPIDALSAGFVSSPPPPGKKPKTEEPPFDSDAIEELSMGFDSSSTLQSAPPEKMPKSEEMPKDALDELVGSLGPADVPAAPQFTGPEVRESKLKSEHRAKLGERDDTIPPEYRKLLEKDCSGEKGTPAGKAEEKEPKTPKKSISENDAIDALSGDFVSSPPSTPQSKAQPGSKTPAGDKTAVDALSSEFVSSTSAATVQSAASPSSPQMSLDAIDELGGSLGSRDDLVPESPKFTGPKVHEKKAKSEHLDKLGERDDTIPLEYRKLLEKDCSGDKGTPAGKAGEKEPKTPKKSISENDAIDALSGDFVSSPPSTPQSKAQPGSKKPEGSTPSSTAVSSEVISSAAAAKVSAPPPKKPVGSTPSSTAVSSEVISSAAAAKVAAPPPKGAKDPLDSLADTLPQQPKDKPTPTVDKVKEKHDSEHRDKLGEREDTIPPEYRFTEEAKGKGQPAKPVAKDEGKGKAPSKTPADDQAAIDALSSGFVSPTSAPKVQSAVSPPPPQKPASSTPSSTGLSSEVISSSAAAKVATPPPKGAKDPLDSLADTLPKQPKDKPTPTVDKVKEKQDSEHRDKLGEREDTIPPDYRFIEEAKGKGQSQKPVAMDDRKGKDPVKTAKDTDEAIDALAGGFSTDSSAKTKVEDKKGAVTSPSANVTVTKETPKSKEQSAAKTDTQKSKS